MVNKQHVVKRVRTTNPGLLPVNTTLVAYAAAILVGGAVLGLLMYFLATNARRPGYGYQNHYGYRSKDSIRLWLSYTPLEPLEPHFICRHKNEPNH